MKRKIFFSFLTAAMLSCVITAQSVYSTKDIIEVSSRVEFMPTIDYYTADVVLELKNSTYYNENSEYRTMEELTNRFYEKLKEAGLNKNLLVENKTKYNAKWNSSGSYEGTLFEFKTKDRKVLDQLMDMRLTGLKLNTIQIETSLSEERYADLVQEALTKAKKRAETIAKAIDKKVIGINGINVGDYNYYSGKSYLDAERKEYFNLRAFYNIE
ncbi:SIMPL domain-containing protein [Gangjinia marincola]